MKCLRVFYLILLLPITLYAQEEAVIQTSKPLIYTDKKLNIMVNEKEDTFTLKLPSNPTTGYGWFLTDYNPVLVQPVDQNYEASQDKKLIGAGGYEMWQFKMKAEAFLVPQLTTIRLVYTRPWQSQTNAKQLTYYVSTH